MDELTEDKIEAKILDAQNILKLFGLPEQQQNRLCALTLLALSNQTPDDQWTNVRRKSMTLSKDIMGFVSKHYNVVYAANTRESFRKQALKPFVEFNIAAFNPDDPTLSATSSKTHYALSDLVHNTLRKYDTPEWDIALENFRKFQFQSAMDNNPEYILRGFHISNYKSIVNADIELGRFNVFIGANGSGKSNLLEILAYVGAARVNDLTLDGLNARGVRFAQPDLMMSSFADQEQSSAIEVSLSFENAEKELDSVRVALSPVNRADPYTQWIDLAEEANEKTSIIDFLGKLSNDEPDLPAHELVMRMSDQLAKQYTQKDLRFDNLLADYAIYDIATSALRGISRVESRKTPLGINGEGLDLLISNLNLTERKYLIKCQHYFDWLDEVIADKKDELRILGLKPGRSTSNLFFTDKFMGSKNNTFSAENSNEGILHVLFYLNLFMSAKTPRIFAIDNIESALNPRLCRVLIKELAKLATEHGKQVLITTHNPAILDGLNLLDSEQRLFEVSRNSKGHTKAERIQFKSGLEDKPFRLSEMWVKGLLGGVPTNF
jgi:predicted ATPase